MEFPKKKYVESTRIFVFFPVPNVEESGEILQTTLRRRRLLLTHCCIILAFFPSLFLKPGSNRFTGLVIFLNDHIIKFLSDWEEKENELFRNNNKRKEIIADFTFFFFFSIETTPFLELCNCTPSSFYSLERHFIFLFI